MPSTLPWACSRGSGAMEIRMSHIPTDLVAAQEASAVESSPHLDFLELIPIYDPRGLRGKEAPALAGGPCTGLQSCPPAFLALLRVTVDAWQRLVSSCEAALQKQMACCDALHHFR